jgi:membrane associated rhomboid family serine protease
MAAYSFTPQNNAFFPSRYPTMGIYDRDYERERYDDEGGLGFNLGGERTLTTNLVIFMFVVYGVQLLTEPSRPEADQGWFTNTLSLHGDVFFRPWLWFEFLSYGFLHDPDDIKHILFNMFGLWMFGRTVEQHYGRREYLLYFLIAVVFAGLCWVLAELAATGQLRSVSLLGASGGIAAVLVLFAVTFPHQRVFLFGVVPMPAWVFALLFIGLDLLGAVGRNADTNVAYTAHLGGAAFAGLYFKSRLRLERWLPAETWWRRLRPGPKLRVHMPDIEEDATDRQVDDVLKKIQEHGQDSLTRRERRILEKASREYQKRRK